MRILKTIATAALATAALAGYANASIIGSAHDFGSVSWSKNQICLPCHTPHNATVKDAQGNPVQGPIWNHQISVAQYTLGQDSTGANINMDVDGNSRLCLSCHDGTVALDSFGGANGTQMIGAQGMLGTDFSNDHPIGSNGVYPTTDNKTSSVPYMVDPSLRAAAGIMPLRPLNGQWVVGCTSCHEPHNRKNTTHMTWVENSGATTTVDGRAVDGSGLCLDCHKK